MTNKKILFIEDDEAHAKLMTMSLNKYCCDCEIIHIKDGLEAINWLNIAKDGNFKDLPMLVILDLNIPTINGIEVLKKIKKDKVLSILPVVVLTTSNSNFDIKICYEEKANSYLVKPIVYNEYLTLICKLKEYWLDSNMNINSEYI